MRHSVALVLAFFVSACSGEGLVEPRTGTLEITTATTGAVITATYTIKVDGGTTELIGHSSVVQRTGIATGSHSVELGGLPTGCTIAGENLRTVTVTTGTTASVSFAVTCTPPVGSIRVITATSGAAPPGYGLLLNGTAQGSIGPTGSRVLEGVSPGTHTVELSVPGNCAPEDGSTRSVAVTAGATAEVSFVLACAGPVGSIRVITATSGEAPPEYSLLLNGTSQGSIVPTGSRVLDGVSPGTHAVELSVPGNCAIEEGNTRSVAVRAGATAEASFVLACAAPVGSIRVITTTTGQAPLSYTLLLDQAGDVGPIVPTGSRVLDSLSAGTHTLILGNVPENCEIEGGNTRTVDVTARGTVEASFVLACAAAIGSIRVTTTTTGGAPVGLSLLLDEVDQGSIASTGSRVLDGVVPGMHTVDLSGVPAECWGHGPISTFVPVSSTVEVPFVLHCGGTGGWSAQSSAGGVAIWGSSGTDVYAVGSPEILHYDGLTWSPMLVPETGIRGIWGNSARDVFAVGKGQQQNGLILHYNGSSWTRMAPPLLGWSSQGSYRSIWGSSGTDVFAVGYENWGMGDSGGLLAHYDGTGWSRMTVPRSSTTSFTDVHGTSARDVWVVGVYTGPWLGHPYSAIWHYDGAAWRESLALEGFEISGVWASSATSVFAVGSEAVGPELSGEYVGAVFHYNGTEWSRMRVPPNTYLSDVWGTSENDVYAVGDGILHFDGNTWTDMGVDRYMQDVWGASASDVFVVGVGILHGPP